MFSLSSLENLLEHIVSKLIFSQLDTLLDQCLKNCIFGIGLSVFYYRLHSAGSILVSSPLGSLL